MRSQADFLFVFPGVAEHPNNDNYQGDDDHQAQDGIEGASDDACRSGDQFSHQNNSKHNQENLFLFTHFNPFFKSQSK